MNYDKREVESVMRIYTREINADLRWDLERPPWGVKFSWGLKNEVRYLGEGPRWEEPWCTGGSERWWQMLKPRGQEE